jgi:hypothetical protein
MPKRYDNTICLFCQKKFLTNYIMEKHLIKCINQVVWFPFEVKLIKSKL